MNALIRRTRVPRLTNYDTPAQREHRQTELAQKRLQYQYESPKTIPGVSFLKGPVDRMPAEMPSRLWVVRAGLKAIRVFLNFLSFHPSAILSAIVLFIKSLFVNISSDAGLDALEISFENHAPRKEVAVQTSRRLAAATLGESQFEEESLILKPYRSMWRLFSRPAIADCFLEDETFSRMRVAGFNPMSLFGVQSMQKLPFWVADEHLPQQGDSLKTAIRENRLYAVDYSALGVIQQQVNSEKTVAVTKGLFIVPPNGGTLQPVAINVNGDTVFPVNEDDVCAADTRWVIAKLALTNNDAIHHEIIAHLGKCHLLVEPFVAATMRQLASIHPLYMLLRPHFEGTVFINDRASRSLVAKAGDVDRIFAGDIESVMRWCAERVLDSKFNEAMPDVEMQNRGVHHKILQMPYREDALEHFQALFAWTYDYLSAYYTDDSEIESDSELQAWAAELVSPDGGRLKGFGDKGDGKVRSVEYLARATAFVIFSASVQHAAVNFPQFAYMAFAPAAPGCLWAKPPTPQETADVARWAKMLTPVDTAVEQIQILSVIGDLYHTRLGKYRYGELPNNAQVRAGLRNYQRKLRNIEARIQRREEGEHLKYEFMRPSRVPQSINI